MSRRVVDIRLWRRSRRYDAPQKERLAATEELLVERLRQLTLPEPPPTFRERNRKTYGEWLQGGGRNRWRD